MKQFLRYQISGMVFIGWSVILYYSDKCGGDLAVAFKTIAQLDKNLIGAAIGALPIGVIIHQFSVLLKNWVFACFIPQLSDNPKLQNLNGLKSEHEPEYTKYILERLSNLNTFFYVRFDNGLLAPGLALIFSYWVFELTWDFISGLVLLMFLIGAFTFSYACRIISELKIYLDMLDQCFEKPENGSGK